MINNKLTYFQYVNILKGVYKQAIKNRKIDNAEVFEISVAYISRYESRYVKIYSKVVHVNTTF